MRRRAGSLVLSAYQDGIDDLEHQAAERHGVHGRPVHADRFTARARVCVCVCVCFVGVMHKHAEVSNDMAYSSHGSMDQWVDWYEEDAHLEPDGDTFFTSSHSCTSEAPQR